AEKGELAVHPKRARPSIAVGLKPMIHVDGRLAGVKQLERAQTGLDPVQFARLPDRISIRDSVARVQIDGRTVLCRRFVCGVPSDTDQFPEHRDPQRFGQRAIIEESFLMLTTTRMPEPAENQNKEESIKAD